MSINATLIAQMITFGILIWFTMKFIWPPLTKAMDERSKKIADGIAAGEKGARSLQDASLKSDEALKAARVQAQEILAAANKQATQLIDQAKVQAKTESDRIAGAARDEVSREVSRAREELRKQVGELAVAGASKILKREIDPKAHADLLNELATRV